MWKKILTWKNRQKRQQKKLLKKQKRLKKSLNRFQFERECGLINQSFQHWYCLLLPLKLYLIIPSIDVEGKSSTLQKG